MKKKNHIYKKNNEKEMRRLLYSLKLPRSLLSYANLD